MLRGVQWWLFGCVAFVALAALAGCSHYLYGERETWRHDAEVACLNSGSVKEGPGRVRIAAISGPGICGADFPLLVSALGESGPLGYDEEAVRPPSTIPQAALPQRWLVNQSNAMPTAPSQAGAPQYSAPPSESAQRPVQELRGQTGPAPASQRLGPPMSIYAPGVPVPEPDDVDFQPAPPRPYDGAPAARSIAAPVAANPLPSYPPPQTYPPQNYPAQNYPPPPQTYPPPNYSVRVEPPPALQQGVPPGPPPAPAATATVGPVELKPAATLACPIVSALDQWMAEAVQPAALRWFRQPVVEIEQISAYACRGMNGNPYAHVSEHAFGNALDIAEFTLADGHRISVQFGWRGTPEEQGFLHDVQLAACEQFSTVLAPGANIYHYNHIHVDLMRRTSGRHICEPAAIPGEVVAERARARYAAQHYGDPGVTGALQSMPQRRALGYSGEGDERLPLAVPGQD